MKKSNRLRTVVFGLFGSVWLTGCPMTPVTQETQKTQEKQPQEQPITKNKSSVKRAEPKTSVVAVRISQEVNQSNLSDTLQAVPLSGLETASFLDIRGVGDSAMALTHQQPLKLSQRLPQGVLANFGQRLDAFDSTGKSYRGDLSFINWESTVGNRCNRFWAGLGPHSFAFVSHPHNMLELYKRGFNLIGLANNHTRDCPNAEEGVDGAYGSARHMEELTQKNQLNWLWHGVGTNKMANIKAMMIRGKRVRVAFASMYIAEGDCTYVTCFKDRLTVLRSLRDADADIRILAMHSWTDATQRELVNTGVNFLSNFDGDIVFGHGPHRWEPVRIVQSSTGKRGVMFESLGNFIHPSLVPSSQHIIGRALFDLNTLQLRQVQIIPINVNRVQISFRGTPNPTKLPANLTWKLVNNPIWQSRVNPALKAAYSNIKQEVKNEKNEL